MKAKKDKSFDPFVSVDKGFDEIEWWIWADVYGERYGFTIQDFLDLPIPVFYKLREAMEEKSKRMKKIKK